jgi:cytochrome d ubiquinol oxidase subunit II
VLSGVLAGALALGALVVVHQDARPIWDGLTSGWGPLALSASAVGGVATLALVRAARYEAARFAAALAVAAVIAGWAIAQSPDLLPGLTVEQAAAGHATIVALVIGVVVGLVVLAPSLALLFSLTLGGRFDPGPGAGHAGVRDRPSASTSPARLWVAGGCLLAGTVLTVLLDSTLGVALGIACLLAFMAIAFAPLATAPRTDDDAGDPTPVP